jgi:hypothetical protein
VCGPDDFFTWSSPFFYRFSVIITASCLLAGVAMAVPASLPQATVMDVLNCDHAQSPASMEVLCKFVVFSFGNGVLHQVAGHQ